MNTPPRNDILLTGLPRSGSTLTCHLLSSLPNVVALHEPMKVMEFAGKSPEEILGMIDAFLVNNRQTLLSEGLAESKNVGGKVPDNPIASQFSEHGLRKSIAERGTIAVEKSLAPGFMLAIKHNAAFAALLEKLVERYPT